MEINNDIIDKILEDNVHHVICEKFNKMCSVTNYGILCDDKFIGTFGSDIIDVSNICDYLNKTYKDHVFKLSDEFLLFED